MLSDTINDALNDQINAEFYSSYLYLSMSNYFEAQNLTGMAQWMRFQAQEELLHAMKFVDYVNEIGGRVVLGEVAAPRTEWDSPLDAFEDTYRHECDVTARINNVVDLVQKEKNHAVNNFLQWFVDEQIEEEASASAIVDHLRLVGDNGVALFMIDKELSGRPAPSITDTNA